MMKMVSYWKDVKEVYSDEEFTLIRGVYDHKNIGRNKRVALGVHWGDYPTSRRILCPCRIPDGTAAAILSGLLHQAVLKKDKEQIQSLTEAIDYLAKTKAAV